ncbi:MAG TPA: CaiB/BaiF CoA-transferase family protein [Casimicrobiaceae bacterium]|nr:CaiB/BaiF CoA-transferase family protein [Casimicrobiaceae bacterium]
MTSPLAGVRVLDLTRLLPGSVCTLHLADLGADVVKIEDLAGGDYARSLGVPAEAAAGSVSAFYSIVNRNKRSLALDLKQPTGRAAFLRLAAKADAVVESFRPGVVDRLGVGYGEVSVLNPRVVYCAISGYGQDGPYRERAGHDVNYLGYAGVLDQTGTAGGPPALSNLQIADLLGGSVDAAMAILAALFDAQRSGRGRYVDVAMADGALAHNIFPLHMLEMRGSVAPRGSDVLTGGAPCYGVYATRDGRYMAVGALEEKFWHELCDLLERPHLRAKQFATGPDGETVRSEIASLFATRTQREWVERFAGADCCVTPVLALEEALANEQFRARGMIVESPRGCRQYASPFKLSDHRFEIRRDAPAQGEHTEEVLREAGFTSAEIAALSGAGAIRG